MGSTLAGLEVFSQGFGAGEGRVEPLHGRGAAGEGERALEGSGFLRLPNKQHAPDAIHIPPGPASELAAQEQRGHSKGKRGSKEQEATGEHGGAVTSEQGGQPGPEHRRKQPGDEKFRRKPKAAKIVIAVVGSDQPGGEERNGERDSDDAGVGEVGPLGEELEAPETDGK